MQLVIPDIAQFKLHIRRSICICCVRSRRSIAPCTRLKPCMPDNWLSGKNDGIHQNAEQADCGSQGKVQICMCSDFVDSVWLKRESASIV